MSKMSLPISSLDYVSSVVDFMIEEYANKQGYQTILRSRFMELVVQLSRQYEKQERHGAQINLMHLAKAISYMEDNYLRPLPAKKLRPNQYIRQAFESDIPVLLPNNAFRLSSAAPLGARMQAVKDDNPSDFGNFLSERIQRQQLFYPTVLEGVWPIS